MFYVISIRIIIYFLKILFKRLQHKRRRYNNYLYQPDPINKYDNKIDVSDVEPKPNTNMWEAVKNTHDMNRSMLNVAYKKKGDYITHIDDKVAVAGTDNLRDVYDDITKIPNWNYNNMFSNAVSDVVATETGFTSTALLTNLVGNPELSTMAGGEIAKRTKEYVMDKTKGIGDVKASQRYQSLDKYLQKNQGINELVGHSLAGSVILEKQQQYPTYTTYTYGAPVISFGDEGDVNRYRTKYEYLSIFDRNAKMLDSNQPFNLPENHSYEGLSGVTANTQLSDGTEILIN